MGVKITSEEAEKEIVFLVEPEAHFVSLVRHGANQQPFRVVKEDAEKGGAGSGHHEHDGRKGGGSAPYVGSSRYSRDGGALGDKNRWKGGEMLMGMVVQSFLVPKDMKLAEIATGNLSWLSEAKDGDAVDFNDYMRLNQLEVGKFDAASLSMVKLHDRGVWAIVGKLLKEETGKAALSIGAEEAKKLLSVPQNPMNMQIASEERPAYVVSFGDMFGSELENFLSVVKGVLSQSGADTKTRKVTVMNALDAFKSFLSMSLDALNTATAKMETPGTIMEQLQSAVQQLKDLSGKINEGGGSAMFKTKEEFVAAVKEVCQPLLDAQLTAMKELVTAAKSEGGPDLKTIKDQLTALDTAQKDLIKKVDGLGDQIITDPAALKEQEAARLKEEAGGEKKSVFAGMLTKKSESRV
jgi:hypothetical protein